MPDPDEASTTPPLPGRKVSIKDVAAAAGVSWKTVSNVVNNSGRVSESTRERVARTIADLGYRPSLAGRQLRLGRTRTLALAIPRIDAAYFASLAHATIAAASRHRYRVFIEETGGDPQLESNIARGTTEHLFDGVILSPLGITLKDADHLRAEVPLVLLGERGGAEGTAGHTDYFSVDNVGAATEAAHHLITTGRTKLAFLGAEPTVGTATLRQQGFTRGLQEAGLEERAQWLIAVDGYNRGAAVAVIEQVLPRIAQIDALMCANDDLALGAMYALGRNGVSVPHDVAVTGWDNTEAGRFSTPTLTTVAPDIEALAADAVERLVRRIEGDSSPHAPRIIAHHLLIRESSAK